MRGYAWARGALAVSVSLTALLGLPAAGMAQAQEEWIEPSGPVRQEGQASSSAQDRRFDMRDDPAFYVSPVKAQNPWGACWAFGSTAAAESSIFADTGKRVDLSERHLTWFSYTPITEADDPSQAGEGFLPLDPDMGANGKFFGGFSSDVLATYASGAGPALESDCPYRGKAGLTELEAMQSRPDDWKKAKRAEVFGGKTDAEIAEKLKDEDQPTIEAYIEETYKTRLAELQERSNNDNHYSALDDWSVPATDASGRSTRSLSAGFLLKDLNIIPSACMRDPDTDRPLLDAFGRPQLDTYSITAVKQELRRGHGVAVTYCAASPALTDEPATYMRGGTFAQYAWKHDNADHTVCIVGWDDDYAVSNFNDGKVSEKTDDGTSVTYDMAPPGPGAWIVKNSWGRKGGTDRKGDQVLGDVNWGVNDSGYFYLSYYDQSVAEFASYCFAEDMYQGRTVAHQYDYLHGESQHSVEGDARLSGANVFSASQDETLTSVATRTRSRSYDARVTYAVYRLRPGATTPTDGELLETIECLYSNPGYHREQLDEPIALKAGERFSVVVTQSFLDEAGRTFYAVSASSALTAAEADRTKGERFYGNAVMNPGESWIYAGGSWQDWKEYLRTDKSHDPDKYVVDNLTIKAFALTAETGSYRWTAGEGQTWKKGTSAGLSFTLERTERAEDTAGHVADILVDDKVLEGDGDHEVVRSDGGAKVTLSGGLLQTLATGEHRLKVLFDDAKALEMPFVVEGGQTDPAPSPSGHTDDGGVRPLPYGYGNGYGYGSSYGNFYGYALGYHYGTHGGAGGYTSHGESGTTGAVSTSTTNTTGTTGTSTSSTSVRRLAGANRYQTMAGVVADAFSSSEACVVASGASFADALAAAGLAGALKAPVVLTAPDALSAEAATQISRLGCNRVLLMGGEAALSPAVESQVVSLGVRVERVAGADRTSTSVAAMRRARSEGSSSDTVFVASGQGFADALAAGPWAWAKAAPVLLCGPDGLLGEEALAALASDTHVRRVVILGGTAAVGNVTAQLPEGLTCERVGGADRYETAKLVAERATKDGLSLSAPYVASGAGFADALAAGPAAGRSGSVLLLSDPSGSSLAQTLRAHADTVRSVTVIGGEAAVGETAIEALRKALR